VRAIPPLLVFLVALSATRPAFAAGDYPPGLFENSPVHGPGQPVAPPAPGSEPGDAAPAAESPGSEPEGEPYDCAGIQSRVFRSLAEVRAAHARCDR
jgi:hypothetical protein